MSEIPTASEIPPEALAPSSRPKKLLGRKLVLAIGLIAVMAVASAFTLVYLMPKGEAATVSLCLKYDVGEKMTYDIIITTSAMGQTFTQQGTISMEILSFDGVNYTIRQTMRLDSQEISYTLRMNKTGHIIDFPGLPPELQQTYSSLVGMPGFGTYFPKEKAKVGESWQIPFNIQKGEFSLQGTVNFGISGVTNITVPAGTYTVFKMDITTNNIHGTYEPAGMTISLALSMNGYGYLENATCHPIEFHIQESATTTSMGQTLSMSMTMQMQLKQHTK